MLHLLLQISHQRVGDRLSKGPVGQRCIRLLHRCAFSLLLCTHYNPMQFSTTLSCTPNTLCKSHKKSRCANHTAVVEQMCKSEEKNSFLLALALSLLHCSVIPSSHTPAQSSPLQHLNTAPPNLLHKYTDTQIHKYTIAKIQVHNAITRLVTSSHTPAQSLPLHHQTSSTIKQIHQNTIKQIHKYTIVHPHAQAGKNNAQSKWPKAFDKHCLLNSWECTI